MLSSQSTNDLGCTPRAAEALASLLTVLASLSNEEVLPKLQSARYACRRNTDGFSKRRIQGRRDQSEAKRRSGDPRSPDEPGSALCPLPAFGFPIPRSERWSSQILVLIGLKLPASSGHLWGPGFFLYRNGLILRSSADLMRSPKQNFCSTYWALRSI